MALPWLIGAAAVAAVAAIASSSDSSSSSSEREERERREREIERENARRREEERKRERKEAERQRQAQIKAKQDYAKNEARALFHQHNLWHANEETMAFRTQEQSNTNAKRYAMECWENSYGHNQDEELSKLENRRKALNQLQHQLKG